MTIEKHANPGYSGPSRPRRTSARAQVGTGSDPPRCNGGMGKKAPLVANELELKFYLATELRKALAASSLLRSLVIREETLTTIYYDTPEQTMWRGGLSLRLRNCGSGAMQSLKSSAHGPSPLLSRREVNVPTSNGNPDFKWLSKVVPNEIMSEVASSTLLPVFRTIVKRCSWEVSATTGIVSVCLDIGAIRCKSRHTKLSELEIELVSGDKSACFDIARQISRVFPIQLQVESKAERGYRLAAGTVAQPRKAEPIRLAADLSTEAGFIEIAYFCLSHFARNQTLFVETESGEALHQMRVAIRRFRCLLRIYRPLVPKPCYRKIRGEARRF